MRTSPRAAALLLSACVVAASPGQDALDRVRRALAQPPDLAVARVAVLELFEEATPDHAQTVARSLAAFREAGAIDAWLQAAERWSRFHPEDPIVAFYRGAAWQDLKHLGRAEEALKQALAGSPDNPAVRELFAWNAVRRFDARAALERAQGATFAGAEELRVEERARLDAEPYGAVAALGALGVALLSLAVRVLARLGR